MTEDKANTDDSVEPEGEAKVPAPLDASSEEPELLTPEEQDDLESAENESRPITYSGQDFDAAGLVGRLNRGDVLIPTFGHNDERISSLGFQRSFVWSRRQMDRFIESLLLGYPVPGIFLVRQPDKRYLVLDGQQRLSTLRDFMEGIHAGREFALKNVANEFKGLTYKSLPDELRRSFDDTFIQATIVASDGTPGALESVYKIFERLNSGGTQLTPHEIRVALYAGTLIEFVVGLNCFTPWRDLYGKQSKRLRDQELVLRVVALYSSSGTYSRPLKGFLNKFAGDHRDLATLSKPLIEDRFQGAANLLLAGPGPRSFRQGNSVNAAKTEATMVGLMRRLDTGEIPDPEGVVRAVDELASSTPFEEAIRQATADEEQVRKRLELATAAFARA